MASQGDVSDGPQIPGCRQKPLRSGRNCDSLAMTRADNGSDQTRHFQVFGGQYETTQT